MVVDAALYGFRIDRLPEFDESRSFVQDVPDDEAQPMGDGPDGLDVSKSNNQALEQGLQPATFGSGGCLGGLTKQAAQEAVAFGGAAGTVLIGALAGSWADTDPGGQLRRRGERDSGGPNLGENLLRPPPRRCPALRSAAAPLPDAAASAPPRACSTPRSGCPEIGRASCRERV